MTNSKEINSKKALGKQHENAGLIAENDAGPEESSFSTEQSKILAAAEAAAIQTLHNNDATTWTQARSIVEQFKPVPWFIWRLSQFVFARPGQIGRISEGLTLGLRKLLFAAASDPFIGSGEKVNSIKSSLKILDSDVIAAVAVIHSVARRIKSYKFERIWRPILEDAILRAQIGFLLGKYRATFGAGRAMLAGFSGRSGLAVLIATGTEEQAQGALELLSTGQPVKDVGLKIYGCEPLQISGLILSASGCGIDAAFGVGAFSNEPFRLDAVEGPARTWLAAIAASDMLRSKRVDAITEDVWDELNIHSPTVHINLMQETTKIGRRGHTLTWLE